MITFHLRSLSLLLLSNGLLLVSGRTAQADILFDFEANAPNTAAPFTDTVNGLSATFGGQASVCASFGLFQSLSGKVLIQNFCGHATESGPLSLAFSANLSSVAFDFATVGSAGSVTLSAFENQTSVGTVNFASSVPAGFLNGEGVARFSGTFDSLSLTGATALAIDNVTAQSAAPEPTALGTILAGFGILAAFARRRKREEGSDQG